MTEQIKIISGRNLKLFLRDKGAVFFSLLSMFVVIGLMLLFLGDVQTENITNILKQIPGHDTANDEKNAKLLILTWTCAGIVSVNAVTVSLSAMSTMIKDKTSGSIYAIYTAPVSRGIIALGYILAAWAASVFICVLTLGITELYCVFCGMEWFSLTEHVKLIGMIMVNSFTYASMMYVAAAVVRSEQAWSGFGTIVGTLTGFLGGIYLPIGQLSEGVGNIMKSTPIIYGTIIFRELMTKNMIQTTFCDIPEEVEDTYREMMGIDLFVFDRQVTTGMALAILGVSGIIFLMIGAMTVQRAKIADR